jgi:hypothetical protein
MINQKHDGNQFKHRKGEQKVTRRNTFRAGMTKVIAAKTIENQPHESLSEHDIQAMFTRWVDNMQGTIPGLDTYHAIPNAGKRSYATAQVFKNEGMRAGVVDTQIPVARGGYVGLAIEFKTLATYETAEQRRRNDRLQQEGWAVFVCRSYDAAVRVTLGYFGMLGLAIDKS